MNDKSLFFLTLSLICIWLILDNFLGKKYINGFLGLMFPFMATQEEETEEETEKEKQERMEQTPQIGINEDSPLFTGSFA